MYAHSFSKNFDGDGKWGYNGTTIQISRQAIRETFGSRHNEGPIEGSSQNLRTSQKKILYQGVLIRRALNFTQRDKKFPNPAVEVYVRLEKSPLLH